MARSDIGTIIIIYVTALLFCYLTFQLKPAAQIYPLCLIAALALLNTLYLGRCLIHLSKHRRETGKGIFNDLPEVFKGFQTRQFFFVACACVAYLFLLGYLGFYLSSFLFMLCVLAYLKVRPMPMFITTAFLGALIYGVFTLFLKVPLPKGSLF